MATTKTLTPTNQTISIPELSDSPDMSVPADAIGKEADAINALNSNLTSLSEQIETSDISGTLAQIESALYTLNSNLDNYASKNVRISPSDRTGVFINASYYGTIMRHSSTRCVVSFVAASNTTGYRGQFVTGFCNSGTWSWSAVTGSESESGYTIAAKNGCTLNAAKLFWNGGLVTAYIDITLGSTVAIGTQIANGLPAPQGMYDNAVTTISNSNSNDQIQAFTIDGYGDLKIAGKAATASRRYRMTFTYIIN